MNARFFWIFMVLIALVSCKQKSDEYIVAENVSLSETKQEEHEGTEPPPLPIVKAGSGVKISAYLIYDDNTRSDFDVLNDSTLVLWNTLIGAGDAGKPSHRLEVKLSGKINNVQLLIKGTDSIYFKKQIAGAKQSVSVEVKDTGCDPIMIEVSKKDEILFQKWIPFRCGE